MTWTLLFSCCGGLTGKAVGLLGALYAPFLPGMEQTYPQPVHPVQGPYMRKWLGTLGRQEAEQGLSWGLPAIAVQPPICTSQMKKRVTGENQIAIFFSSAKMVMKGGDT